MVANWQAGMRVVRSGISGGAGWQSRATLLFAIASFSSSRARSQGCAKRGEMTHRTHITDAACARPDCVADADFA
jgi:hypothetical protein